MRCWSQQMEFPACGPLDRARRGGPQRREALNATATAAAGE